MASKKEESVEIQVQKVQKETVEFAVLGLTPLVFHRQSLKVKQGLLLPAPKKNALEKATTAKHDPLQEYRDSVYRSRSDVDATRLVFPAGAFHDALASVATDVPGARAAQIGRLTEVLDWNVPIYGTPQLYMTTVRSADINRTPDVRTRAILPRWAARLRVRFVTPNLNTSTVTSLLVNAGALRGIGDGRVEKGAFNFGQFEPCSDPLPAEFTEILNEGREAQDAALENPTFWDDESEELFRWFQSEAKKRSLKVVA